MTALRIKNERRSIPGGTADSLGNSWNGPSSLGEAGALMSCSGLVFQVSGLWVNALRMTQSNLTVVLSSNDTEANLLSAIAIPSSPEQLAVLGRRVEPQLDKGEPLGCEQVDYRRPNLAVNDKPNPHIRNEQILRTAFRCGSERI
jgi:hypothetical protein